MHADLTRFLVDVRDEDILHRGDEIGLLLAFDLVELVGGVGEHVHHRADIRVGEVVIDVHADDLGVEVLTWLELDIVAANGEHLALERGGSIHVVDLGQLHEHHVALHALARRAEGRTVHVERFEPAQHRSSGLTSQGCTLTSPRTPCVFTIWPTSIYSGRALGCGALFLEKRPIVMLLCFVLSTQYSGIGGGWQE